MWGIVFRHVVYSNVGAKNVIKKFKTYSIKNTSKSSQLADPSGTTYGPPVEKHTQ